MGDLTSKGWMSFGADPEAQPPRRPRGLALTSLSWIGGAIATTLAVTTAAVLTVVFAATMAVILVLTSALIALCAFAMRARRQNQPKGVLIEARKVGHSWIAYGWDERPR